MQKIRSVNDTAYKSWLQNANQKVKDKKRSEDIRKTIHEVHRSVSQVDQQNLQAVKEWRRQKRQQEEAEQHKMRKLISRNTKEARKINNAALKMYGAKPERKPRTRKPVRAASARSPAKAKLDVGREDNRRVQSARAARPARPGSGRPSSSFVGTARKVSQSSLPGREKRLSILDLVETNKEGQAAWGKWVDYKNDQVAPMREGSSEAERAQSEQDAADALGKKIIEVLWERAIKEDETNCDKFASVLLLCRAIFMSKAVTVGLLTNRPQSAKNAQLSRKMVYNGLKSLGLDISAKEQGVLYNNLQEELPGNIPPRDITYHEFEFYLISLQAERLDEEERNLRAELKESDREQVHRAAGLSYLTSQLLEKMGYGRRPFGDIILRTNTTFRRMDANGDTYLQKHEWIEGMRRMDVVMTEMQCVELFDNIDSSRDGEVSYTELENLLIRCCHGRIGRKTSLAIINDKDDLTIGDVMPVNPAASVLTLRCGWDGDDDVDVGVAIFAKDAMVMSCYFDNADPDSLHRLVLTGDSKETGVNCEEIRVKVCCLSCTHASCTKAVNA